MRRKILTLILSLLMVLCATFGAACNLFGKPSDEEVVRERSKQFVAVMNKVFQSAEFAIVEDSAFNDGTSQSSDIGGGNVTFSCPLSASAYGQANTPSQQMQNLTQEFMGNNGIPLNENNKKAIKGEAMSLASQYAGMVKSLMVVYGDKVFENNYAVENNVFKVSQKNGVSAIQGVLDRGTGFSSGVIMNFEEKDGEYLFNYASYGYNGGTTHPFSEIEFAYYNSGVGAMHVEMEADGREVLTNYEDAYAQFEVSDVLFCSFDLDNYVADTLTSSTPSQRQTLFNFANQVMNFGNSTVADLMAIQGTVQIQESDIARLNEVALANYYVSPYYYQTNDTFVRESYVVPSNVTVITKGSIPATKKVYIHENVTKIESMPFEKPQYLEEIIFDNPTGGKLTQIGSFDQRVNGRPTFILSMTKVKNFTLPSTVKKLELGDYVVQTHVEKIDLSSYDPTWINNKAEFTYTFATNDFPLPAMENDYKDKGRNKAYTTLNICGHGQIPYKEMRYIENLYMPKFNMGITFDSSWYEIQLGNDGYDVIYAYDNVTRLIRDTEITFEEWINAQNFTFTCDVIGKVYVNQTNTIISSDFLFSDFVADKGKGEKDDKDEKDDLSFLYKWEECNINFYDSFEHSDFMKDYGKNSLNHATIREVIVYESDYQAIANAEQEGYDRWGYELSNQRVTLTKR